MRAARFSLKDKSAGMARLSALSFDGSPTIFQRNARGENP
jgi:hypothetical protein